MIRSGERVLLVYPEGDADTVKVLALTHEVATVLTPAGKLRHVALEDIGIGVGDEPPFRLDDGCTTYRHVDHVHEPVCRGCGEPVPAIRPDGPTLTVALPEHLTEAEVTRVLVYVLREQNRINRT